jgi:hypothetical protein
VKTTHLILTVILKRGVQTVLLLLIVFSEDSLPTQEENVKQNAIILLNGKRSNMLKIVNVQKKTGNAILFILEKEIRPVSQKKVIKYHTIHLLNAKKPIKYHKAIEELQEIVVKEELIIVRLF